MSQDYLTSVRFEFSRLNSLAEKALVQISDDDFLSATGSDNNSIAIIVKHVGGNLRSRFSDFLMTDGEKPDRNRDREFEISPNDNRESLMQAWQSGWKTLRDTLEQLQEDDLTRAVYIRGEAHTVTQAMNRSLTHLAYHVGQIVLLCKGYAGENWQTLSVAKGGSEQFRKKPSSYLGNEDA